MITDRPEPRQAGRRRWGRLTLIILAVVVLLLLLTLRAIATFYTDYLWFKEVGFTDVFWTVLRTKLLLGVAFGVASFLLLWGNLIVVDRFAPEFVAVGQQDDVLERYRTVVGPYMRWIRAGLAAAIAFFIGIGVSSRWQEALLFLNREPFGVEDDLYSNDVGFYVFVYPFIRFTFQWLFSFLLVVTALTAFAAYLNGGIRVAPGLRSVTTAVKVHLSLLLAGLALLKAVGYWLDRYDLLYSTRGPVQGATYTDVKAQLPALTLLLGISVIAAILLLVNIRFRGWSLPAVAGGSWLVASILVGFVYPTVIQQFRVNPDESGKEAPYISSNIEATLDAFDLAEVTVAPYQGDAELTRANVDANRATIDNLRLWEPEQLAITYAQQQEIRAYYEFLNVDVDRYMIDGAINQVMLAAREQPTELIQQHSWVNDHLAYTHGQGVVISDANRTTDEGLPIYLVQDIPPVPAEDVADELTITQPRLYFGESGEGFKIVNTETDELDFPSGDATTVNNYDGTGGVELNGFLRRAAFALRFGDFNILISSSITGDSRLMFNRSIVDRVRAAAPFLSIDSDPYPVVVDGAIVWMVDLYTTTDRYPYAQTAATDRVPETELGLSGADFNYVRNSVKAVVDAFTGAITFYVWDETDPIIQAYAAIFPDMFRPATEMPEELQSHVRYPEDLFRVQSNMFQRYHVVDPIRFYQNEDAWQVPADPSRTTTATEAEQDGTTRRMQPYYLLIDLPGGGQDLQYIIMQPFTPVERNNMTSFLVADSSAGSSAFGQLTSYQLPIGRQIEGPLQVAALINQDTTISQQITLLDQQGSRVSLGNILVVPIDEGLIYVQPLYVVASSSGQGAGSTPELKRVIVVSGNTVRMENTFEEALNAVFGGAGTPTPTEPDPAEPSEPAAEVAGLIEEASRLYDEAQDALREGDLGQYQELVDQVAALLGEAAAASGVDGPSTTTTAPPSTTTTVGTGTDTTVPVETTAT